MVVEFLRPCHRGTWRLFRDRPDVLTKGRFYFVPDDTPHYPGPHNLWSPTWTRNNDWPELPPPLGPDHEKATPWTAGMFGTTLPPAASIGSPGCIGGGEVYPPQTEGRVLIGGVDSRCWTGRGMPVPPQTPVMLLEGPRIKTEPGSDLAHTWLDASPLNVDCIQSTIEMQPDKVLEGEFPAVAGDDLHYLERKEAFDLRESWSAHLVIKVDPDGLGGPEFVDLVSGTEGQALVSVEAGQVNVRGDGWAAGPFASAGMFDAVKVVSVLKADGKVTVLVNGAPVGAEVVGPGKILTATVVTPVADYGETGAKAKLLFAKLYAAPQDATEWLSEAADLTAEFT